MTVTKADLISEVAKLGVTEKTARKAVQLVIDLIVDAIKSGEKVQLSNFGNFRIKKRRARKGRNPKTGAAVMIPEKRVPVFRASERLKQAVQAGK